MADKDKKWRTKYDDSDRVFCNPGLAERIVYGSELDKNHEIVVTEKGKENLYAYINSFADSCDLNVLIARFTNGDQMALKQRMISYMDIADIPTNLNDFVDFTRRAASFFDTLPVEVKQKFDNNVYKFTSMIGSKEFDDAMNTTQAAEMAKVAQASAEASKVYKDEVNHVPKVTQNPGSGADGSASSQGGDIS